MQTLDFIMIAVAYLCGSVPFAQIMFFLIRRDDIRKYGSGNVGATNVARNVGMVPGIVTLLLDIVKGWLPVAACGWVGIAPDSWTIALAAIAALLGHMFPVWLGFRGGKGVATAVGVFAAINWVVLLCALAVFVVVILITRIVSLSSIIAAAAFAVCAFVLGPGLGMALNLQIGALVAAVLIIAKHHQNIGRLLAGTEKKFGTRKETTAEKAGA